MSEQPKIIRPGEEGKLLKGGSEIILPVTEYTDKERTVFSVSESPAHEQFLQVEEQTDEKHATKAKAYFRKGKKLTYEMIPDHIKGEEGRRFLRIVGALAVVAGAGTYIVLRNGQKP